MVHLKKVSRNPTGSSAMAAALTLFCLATLAGCATDGGPQPRAPAPSQQDLVADGQLVAVLRCASCHAIDHDEVSLRADAPPLKTLGWRYDPDMPLGDLVKGMSIGHEGMPRIDLTALQTQALAVYIQSISDPPTGR